MKVGVIGTGNMGRHHVRVYSEFSDVELVAISDINPEQEKLAKKFKCKFYHDYNEMLKREDIEAVSVVVPTKVHRKVALDVIRSGKHLLIEKPIAGTLEHAQEVISAAKEKKVKLMIGHIERFNPVIVKLKEILESGKIGKVISMVAIRVGGMPRVISDNNVIIDLAVHDIDLFNCILRKTPRNAYCTKGKALNSENYDYAEILLDYEGTGCFSQVNWITPVKVRTLSVTGDRGYIEVDYLTQELVLYETTYEPFDTYGEFILKFGSPKKEVVYINKVEPLKLELKSFIECIKNDKEPVVTGEDGLRALQIALKALEG